MIHFLITAGGTIEEIDEIRRITNTSTGQLGVCIYNAIVNKMDRSQEQELYTIHYVVTKSAQKPTVTTNAHGNTLLYEVDTTESVYDCIERLLNEENMDYVIHCMAISDFKVASVTPIKSLAKELAEQIEKDSIVGLEELIEQILRNPLSRIDNQTKISSRNDLILTMTRTPKVIDLFKQMCPDCVMVGFKLLKNVSEEELIRVSTEMANQTECDFVLANDFQSIQAGAHEGLLIEEGKVIGRYNGKEEIAQGIVENLFRRKRK